MDALPVSLQHFIGSPHSVVNLHDLLVRFEAPTAGSIAEWSVACRSAHLANSRVMQWMLTILPSRPLARPPSENPRGLLCGFRPPQKLHIEAHLASLKTHPVQESSASESIVVIQTS